MQARFYDAQVGRFLSTDPVDFKDDDPFTFNRYAYGNNNPYRYTDPNGEFAQIAIGAGIGFVVGVAVEGYNQLTTASGSQDFNGGAMLASGVRGALIGAAATAGGVGLGALAAAEGATGAGLATAEVAGAAYAAAGSTLVVSPAVDQVQTGGIKSSGTYAVEAGAAAVGTVVGGSIDKAAGAALGTVARTAVSTAGDTAAGTAAQAGMTQPPAPMDKKEY